MSGYSSSDYWATPLMTGALASVGTMVFAPEVASVNLPLINVALPSSVGIGVVSASADLLGNFAAGKLLPAIGVDDTWNKILPPAAVGAANAALLMTGQNNGPIGKLSLITTGSAVAATYVKQNYF